MASIDITSASVANYLKQFLKEIDSTFLDPNFDP